MLLDAWVPTPKALLFYLPPEYQYISLQKDIVDSDKETLLNSSQILNFSDDLIDFSVTAALAECMDLVISVDTSVAHLAGALGKKTWVLLPYGPDWRWMLDRKESPWYPTMELWRQPKTNDWVSVFERVQARLRDGLKKNIKSNPIEKNISQIKVNQLIKPWK